MVLFHLPPTVNVWRMEVGLRVHAIGWDRADPVDPAYAPVHTYGTSEESYRLHTVLGVLFFLERKGIKAAILFTVPREKTPLTTKGLSSE